MTATTEELTATVESLREEIERVSNRGLKNGSMPRGTFTVATLPAFTWCSDPFCEGLDFQKPVMAQRETMTQSNRQRDPAGDWLMASVDPDKTENSYERWFFADPARYVCEKCGKPTLEISPQVRPRYERLSEQSPLELLKRKRSGLTPEKVIADAQAARENGGGELKDLKDQLARQQAALSFMMGQQSGTAQTMPPELIEMLGGTAPEPDVPKGPSENGNVEPVDVPEPGPSGNAEAVVTAKHKQGVPDFPGVYYRVSAKTGLTGYGVRVARPGKKGHMFCRLTASTHPKQRLSGELTSTRTRLMTDNAQAAAEQDVANFDKHLDVLGSRHGVQLDFEDRQELWDQSQANGFNMAATERCFAAIYLDEPEPESSSVPDVPEPEPEPEPVNWGELRAQGHDTVNEAMARKVREGLGRDPTTGLELRDEYDTNDTQQWLEFETLKAAGHDFSDWDSAVPEPEPDEHD